jgi:sugar/nucleoside kinase (ribokinase family)
MPTDFYAFGEILWDCLPSGRHAGGAPFNVTAHLAQIGVSASLISCIGRDSLGDEILKVAQDKKVNTEFITRARIGLATGTVIVTVDASGNATYELVQPAAWDEIGVSAEALEAVSKARALIYGSLAGRSPYNLDQLAKLLEVKGPLRFFDVNLRPPFADPPLVMELAKRAHVLKLNDGEVGQLAHWLRTGDLIPDTPRTLDDIAAACATIAEATNASHICHHGRRRRRYVGQRQSRDRAGTEGRRQRHRWGGGRFHGRPHGRADAWDRDAKGFGGCLPARGLRRLP